MDSGEMNKIAGGVLGALLGFLLLGFFSGLIYHGAGGHDEEDRVLAFAVEVEETGGGGEAEEAVDYAALLAAADPTAGESAFNKCKACHGLEEGANGVGPHLHGVVGRDIAGVEGFSYSDALISKEGAWGLVNLFEFIHNPSGWAPGTKMGFAGLSDDQDKVDLIAFLNQQSGAPVELTAPAAPEGEEPAAEGEEPAADEGEQSAEGETQAAESEQSAEGDEAGEGEAQADAGASGEMAQLLASADEAAGEKVFNKCRACHKLEEGGKGVGPHLHGVVGRPIASVEGFSYSDALAGEEGDWTADKLSAYLEDPKGWAPGTKMSFAGLPDAEDRANVIVYLNQQGDSPVDFSTAAPAAEAEGQADAAEAEGDGQAAADGQSGAEGESALLDTAEDAGKEDTGERDAVDKGVPSDSSDVKEAELSDEEEAEAKISQAADSEGTASETYSEQQSGLDELDPDTTAEAAGEDGADATEPAGAEAGSAPGSEAMTDPDAVVDEEVDTEARVLNDTTSGSTVLTEEDRPEPLPEMEADDSAEEAEGEAGGGEQTAEADADAADSEGSQFAELLAAASAENGEKVFRKCRACHQLEDGKNTIGPHLHGVIGREIASVEGYRYTDALSAKEGIWDLATLDAFLEDPKGWAAGTKMSFAGLDDPQDRVDVITYINEASGAPVDLGAAEGGTRQAAALRDDLADPGTASASAAEAARQAAEAVEQATAAAASAEKAADEGEDAAAVGGTEASGTAIAVAETAGNAAAGTGEPATAVAGDLSTPEAGTPAPAPDTAIGRVAAAADAVADAAADLARTIAESAADPAAAE